MIKAVIFDMDGLLIDSEPLWSRAYKDAFQTVGAKITDEDMHGIRGRLIPEAVAHLYDKYHCQGRSQKDIEALIYEDMIAMIKKEGELLPGVHQVFDICKKGGLATAIASSSPNRIIDTVVDSLKIRDFFDHIYSAEHEQFGKPHPGVFITTADLLGVKPEQCLVFEDAPLGVLAAKAARMKCVAVPDPALIDHPFIRTADIVINSLEEFDHSMLDSLRAG